MIVCIRLHYIYENKILPYVIVGFACRSCCYLKKQTIHKMMSFEVMEINIYIYWASEFNLLQNT